MHYNKCKSCLKKSTLLKKLYSDFMRKKYSLMTLISPKLNAKMKFKAAFKKKLDLKNPVTLNEKLLWLKLNKYNNDPLVIQCADKYLVREYVKECACTEILNEIIGVYNKAKDIQWDIFPQQFVLKWNFGAGRNIICDNKSKFDRNEVVKRLHKWGKDKCWLPDAEMQYKYIPKKIICEKYLSDSSGIQPKDYKIYCFNGKPVYCMLCVGRGELEHPKFYFFDKDMKLQRINKDSKAAPEDFYIEKPEGYDDMFRYAEILSKPFPFVRADFYVINSKVIFGELTFTPAGSLDVNRLPETDRLMGDMLKLEM